MLGLAALTGCESGHDAKLQKDERHLHEVVQGQLDGLQWRIDDAIAARILDDGTIARMNRYLAFRKCHSEPPTHEANRKVCSALQARVAAQEAKDRTRTAKEKAAW